MTAEQYYPAQIDCDRVSTPTKAKDRSNISGCCYDAFYARQKRKKIKYIKFFYFIEYDEIVIKAEQ